MVSRTSLSSLNNHNLAVSFGMLDCLIWDEYEILVLFRSYLGTVLLFSLFLLIYSAKEGNGVKKEGKQEGNR